MSAYVRLALIVLCALVLAGGAAALVRRYLPKRTIANWYGSGADTDLAPYQAAVLLAVHPSRIVAILLEELRLRGRALAHADPYEPCRMEWTGGDPETPVEKALVESVDAQGTFRPEGVIGLVETMWSEVNDAMVPWSGPATVAHYREMAEELWDQDFAALTELPGSFPFFLLVDPGRAWDRIGNDPVSERFRESFRIGERFRDRLVPAGTYGELARRARTGFFRYRPDLKGEGPPDEPVPAWRIR